MYFCLETHIKIEIQKSISLSKINFLARMIIIRALNFKHIKELYISGCWKLEEIQGLEASENLRFLHVIDLCLLEKLPDLTNSKELTDFGLRYCPRLVEIWGMPKSVLWLHIDASGSLQKSLDPLSFDKVGHLEICESQKPLSRIKV